MAINKNDFKNPEGNYEAKNSLVDVLVDGVNTNAANISLLPLAHMRDAIRTDAVLDLAEGLKNGEVCFFATNTIDYPVGGGVTVSAAGFAMRRWEQRFIMILCSDGKIRTRHKSSDTASWPTWEVK